MSTTRRPSGEPHDGVQWAWLVIGCLAAIDAIWAWRAGFRFEGFRQLLPPLAGFLALGIVCGYSVRIRWLRDLGHYAALWLAFAVVVNVASYLAATMRLPLCDGQLSALDQLIGFQWLPWFSFLRGSHVANLVLPSIYSSIILQAFASVVFFALIGSTERNRELFWIALFAAIATVAISGFVPALGPMTADSVPKWTTTLLKIRAGTLHRATFSTMPGIIAFPSFHTVLAMVFVYVHRPPFKTFIPIAAINALMLAATPFLGHHYLTDVIGGVAVTVIAIVAYRIATAPALEQAGMQTRPALAIQRANRS